MNKFLIYALILFSTAAHAGPPVIWGPGRANVIPPLLCLAGGSCVSDFSVGSIGIGSNVSGGGNNQFIYTDGSGNLIQDPQATRDSSTHYTTISTDVPAVANGDVIPDGTAISAVVPGSGGNSYPDLVTDGSSDFTTLVSAYNITNPSQLIQCTLGCSNVPDAGSAQFQGGGNSSFGTGIAVPAFDIPGAAFNFDDGSGTLLANGIGNIGLGGVTPFMARISSDDTIIFAINSSGLINNAQNQNTNEQTSLNVNPNGAIINHNLPNGDNSQIESTDSGSSISYQESGGNQWRFIAQDNSLSWNTPSGSFSLPLTLPISNHQALTFNSDGTSQLESLPASPIVGNGQVAFGDPSTGVVTSSSNYTFSDDNAGGIDSNVGDISNSFSHIQWHVNAGLNGSIQAPGYENQSFSGFNFTGSGVNDIQSSPPGYTGLVTNSYSAVIDSVGTYQVLNLKGCTGTFQVGDTVNQISQAAQANVAAVYSWGSHIYLTVDSVAGPWEMGSGGPNFISTSAGTGDGQCTELEINPYDVDTISVTVAGFGAPQSLMPITGGGMQLQGGENISFATETGHTLSDEWDWSYDPQFGQMFYLNANGAFGMGDVSFIGRRNAIRIDDSSGGNAIELSSQGEVRFTDGGENTYFKVKPSAPLVEVTNTDFAIDGGRNFHFDGIADGSFVIGQGTPPYSSTLITNFGLNNTVDTRMGDGWSVGASGGHSFYEIAGDSSNHLINANDWKIAGLSGTNVIHFSDTSSSFDVFNPSDPASAFFHIDNSSRNSVINAPNGTVTIGDSYNFSNGTQITVSDGAMQMGFQANSTFNFRNVAGNAYLQVYSGASGLVQGGDLNQVANQVIFHNYDLTRQFDSSGLLNAVSPVVQTVGMGTNDLTASPLTNFIGTDTYTIVISLTDEYAITSWSTGGSNTINPGDSVTQAPSGAVGTVHSTDSNYITIDTISGAFVNGQVITDVTSASTISPIASSYSDIYSWSDTLSQSADNIPASVVTNLNNGVSATISLTFGSALGHSFSDTFTVSVNGASGRQILADYSQSNAITSIGDIDGIGQSTKIVVDDNTNLISLSGLIRLPIQGAGVTPQCAISSHDGRVAFTSAHILCVCNGSTPAWVQVSDGSTACTF